MQREELEHFLETTLESGRFADYSPNGLQVEGRSRIERVTTGVTASLALVEEAVRRGADALIVHHGYFWKGESACLTGYRRQRIATLLRHEINLFAYHLPLDAHPELGNNARWGAIMGWRALGRFGAQDLGWHGEIPKACALAELARQMEARLSRKPLLIGDPERLVRRVAWCSGGAQGYLEEAAKLGVDVYLSGEISEQTLHIAQETGVAYLACGHHATERFGIKALSEHITHTLGLPCEFIDLENPA
jgi:dinuclear metal center YbgI/SA1388 family protein